MPADRLLRAMPGQALAALGAGGWGPNYKAGCSSYGRRLTTCSRRLDAVHASNREGR